MKKKALIAGGIVLAVAAAGFGIWFGFFRNKANTTEEKVYVSKVSTLLNAGSSMGMQTRFSGVVEPQDTWEVNQKQDKTVKDILVEQGQEVVVGTPLFNYDTAQAESDLSQAQLDLERIDNDITNLSNQIKTLEKEKKAAGADEKLNYTTQIQTAQTDIKKSEYEKKSKNVEIGQLQESIDNATVTSEIAGVVKSINQGGSSMDGSSQAFMTILQTGEYRIKGSVNEQNIMVVTEGAKVIIRSRTDSTKTWTGTLGKVDTENPNANNNNGGMYVTSADGSSENKSSTWPFYVTLDSSDGLMMGQHVYIEMDMGQEEPKLGVWLDEYMISDIDTSPYVWADNGEGKLEKRSVILGQHDENLLKYEIADGLTEDDAITFPEETLVEGMATEISGDGMMGNTAAMGDASGEDGEGVEDGVMTDGEEGTVQMEGDGASVEFSVGEGEGGGDAAAAEAGGVG